MVEVTGGASVSSKGKLPTGLRAKYASGNKVVLQDGRHYVDWPMGLHGAIYGYAPVWWTEALRLAVSDGQSATYPSRDERVVAEMLGRFYPDIEAVRFMCTGSDPCAAAVKLARAVTGRRGLLVYGYHGSASAYCTPPSVSGVEKRGGTIDVERLSFFPLEWGGSFPLLKDVAAVVVEVPSEQPYRADWLGCLADACQVQGSLFVLDEVKTAFRSCPGGAAETYDVMGKVDLYCFGKTLGNGYPISCLAGRKAILDELTKTVHYSGTFFGEPLGLAAAKATLLQLQLHPPWGHLFTQGTSLMAQWNAISQGWKLGGHPTRPYLYWGAALTSVAGLSPFCDQAAFLKRGHIVMREPWYMTTETDERDIYRLITAMEEVYGS